MLSTQLSQYLTGIKSENNTFNCSVRVVSGRCFAHVKSCLDRDYSLMGHVKCSGITLTGTLKTDYALISRVHHIVDPGSCVVICAKMCARVRVEAKRVVRPNPHGTRDATRRVARANGTC